LTFVQSYQGALLRTSPASSDVSTLSLHDALPISWHGKTLPWHATTLPWHGRTVARAATTLPGHGNAIAWHATTFPRSMLEAEARSEEHTSELQSLTNLVCRLRLEKKKHITLALLR